jgi:hypothetical protein
MIVTIKKNNEVIAERISLSENTVENFLNNDCQAFMHCMSSKDVDSADAVQGKAEIVCNGVILTVTKDKNKIRAALERGLAVYDVTPTLQEIKHSDLHKEAKAISVEEWNVKQQRRDLRQRIKKLENTIAFQPLDSVELEQEAAKLGKLVRKLVELS